MRFQDTVGFGSWMCLRPVTCRRRLLIWGCCWVLSFPDFGERVDDWFIGVSFFPVQLWGDWFGVVWWEVAGVRGTFWFATTNYPFVGFGFWTQDWTCQWRVFQKTAQYFPTPWFETRN